jgi:uncharacterized protein (TIGR01244 family)
MDIRQITPRFFAAPQISVEDIPDIAAAGIRLVICNRPDAEVPPSHQAAAIEAAVRAQGLGFAVCPLTHQTMTPDVIAENRDFMKQSDGPVLAYCASGTRSTIAWALGMATELPSAEILAAAAKGGYDLSNLRPTLDSIAKNAS